MMTKVLSALALVALFQFGLGQNAACDLTQQTIMGDVMQCLAHDPQLMLQIVEHMKNPDSMASTDFVCRYKKDIVDLMVCMEDKLLVCLPEMFRPMVKTIFSKEKLEKVIAFVCEHKDVLGNDKCMTQESQLQYMSCMQQKGTELGQQLGLEALAQSSFTGLQCKLDQAFEKCIERFHGTCSADFVSLMEQAVQILIPQEQCGTNQATGKLLGSLLLRGAPLGQLQNSPLKYEPTGNLGVPYVIKG